MRKGSAGDTSHRGGLEPQPWVCPHGAALPCAMLLPLGSLFSPRDKLIYFCAEGARRGGQQPVLVEAEHSPQAGARLCALRSGHGATRTRSPRGWHVLTAPSSVSGLPTALSLLSLLPAFPSALLLCSSETLVWSWQMLLNPSWGLCWLVMSKLMENYLWFLLGCHI